MSFVVSFHENDTVKFLSKLLKIVIGGTETVIFKEKKLRVFWS